MEQPLGGELLLPAAATAAWGCCLLLAGCSCCDFCLVLLELGLSLSSDKEEKMLWELFLCCDWETLQAVCWKGCGERGVPELWSAAPIPCCHGGAGMGGTVRLREPIWVTPSLEPGENLGMLLGFWIGGGSEALASCCQRCH